MRPAATLPRASRLIRPADFKLTFKDGRRVHQPPISLVYRVNGLAHPRIGLAIGKRQAKLAVERNRVKRQLREDFRQRFEELPALDCVVYLNAGSVSHNNLALRTAIDRIWQKVKDKCNAS